MVQANADKDQAIEAANAAKAGMDAAKSDIDAKASAIKSAEAQIVRWQAEVDRATRLVMQKTFDQATLDEQIKELRVSEAKKDEATANWRSAQANFQKASAYFHKTKADIEVARASILVAEAARDQWADWLSYKYITASRRHHHGPTCPHRPFLAAR